MRLRRTSRLRLCDERHGLRPDRLTASNRVQPLVGLRLDVDPRHVNSHRFSEFSLHDGDILRHLRAFGQDCSVDVGDLETALFEQFSDVAQKDEAVGARPARVFVGEMRADVAERGGAEQRVGYRMRQAVAVRMSQQAALIRYFDPAQDQLAPFDQSVDVITYAYSKLVHN